MPARFPEASQQPTNGAVNGNSSYSGNDEIVISGISGRLPESNSIAEFRENLFAGLDLVTDDERRWPAGNFYSFKICVLFKILFFKHKNIFEIY